MMPRRFRSAHAGHCEHGPSRAPGPHRCQRREARAGRHARHDSHHPAVGPASRPLHPECRGPRGGMTCIRWMELGSGVSSWLPYLSRTRVCHSLVVLGVDTRPNNHHQHLPLPTRCCSTARRLAKQARRPKGALLSPPQRGEREAGVNKGEVARAQISSPRAKPHATCDLRRRIQHKGLPDGRGRDGECLCIAHRHANHPRSVLPFIGAAVLFGSTMHRRFRHCPPLAAAGCGCCSRPRNSSSSEK